MGCAQCRTKRSDLRAAQEGFAFDDATRRRAVCFYIVILPVPRCAWAAGRSTFAALFPSVQGRLGIRC